MDWKRTQFDWSRARAFLVTAEEGSYSAAARALGLAQPTLGRQVAALEDELGVTLFERSGNRLELTPTGINLLEQVRAMNAAAGRMALIAAGQAQAIDGLVRVAAGEALAAYLLPEIIGAIRGLHPGVQIEIVVSSATSDLRRREADIAVRHVQPQGGELIARRIKARSLARLYGAPDYLERIGNPGTPADLAGRGEVIGFDETDNLRNALLGAGLEFPGEQFPIRTESHLVQWELARCGLGLCVMMEEIGDHDLALVRALPDHPGGIPFPTWLVSHRELRGNRRIRTVFDLLAGMLMERLARPPPGD